MTQHLPQARHLMYWVRVSHLDTELASLLWECTYCTSRVLEPQLSHNTHAAFFMGMGDLISDPNTDIARVSLTEPTPSLLTVPFVLCFSSVVVFYGHLAFFYQSTEHTFIFTISEKPLHASPHGPWKWLPLATSELMPPIIQKEKYHSIAHLTWKISWFAFADVALGYLGMFCGPGCISVNWANHFLKSEKFASVVLQKAFREAIWWLMIIVTSSWISQCLAQSFWLVKRKRWFPLF